MVFHINTFSFNLSLLYLESKGQDLIDFLKVSKLVGTAGATTAADVGKKQQWRELGEEWSGV